MNVLIANYNKEFINNLIKEAGLSFKPAYTYQTVNTSTFSIGRKDFDKLTKFSKEKGYNSYSLFAW